MGEKTFIYCPLCHQLVYIFKGRITADIESTCPKCGTLVTFKALSKRTVTQFTKIRKCSSGYRF